MDNVSTEPVWTDEQWIAYATIGNSVFDGVGDSGAARYDRLLRFIPLLLASRFDAGSDGSKIDLAYVTRLSFRPRFSVHNGYALIEWGSWNPCIIFPTSLKGEPENKEEISDLENDAARFWLSGQMLCPGCR